MTVESICEIEDCGRAGCAVETGITVCERCRRDLVSAGVGTVYFAGRWHGVIGATYTAEVRSAFPGVE